MCIISLWIWKIFFSRYHWLSRRLYQTLGMVTYASCSKCSSIWGFCQSQQSQIYSTRQQIWCLWWWRQCGILASFECIGAIFREFHTDEGWQCQTTKNILVLEGAFLSKQKCNIENRFGNYDSVRIVSFRNNNVI